ncbi:hypothetical protein OJAV_G00039830 [Oryzias javanicus]|uniref:CCDC66 domain-containing protein n=1 Tax=Oryzias javanicus TaxID=123683 RepID=A0A3S2N3C6_ORYJA|nr:hypothetical protein OJAV_G00039830 [Oryzias javanicus]
MKIGDGLLFELENGKPKLILLNRGAENNPAKPLSLRSRPANVLSSRQPPYSQEVQGDGRSARQLAGRHREVRSKAEGGASSAHSSIPITQTEGRKTKRHDHPRQDCVKQKSNKRCAAVRQKDGRTDEKEVLADGDQLQQILNDFQTSCRDKEEDHMGPKFRGSEPTQRGEEGIEKIKETETTVNSQENVSSWLEEQLPHSEAASSAKKAQWRRDLDEQVEQKEHHSAHVRLQDEGGSSSHTEQRAAIRSSLRLGDVSPIEMEQNMEKKEEQRRCWLQELDCQRQEMTERRRLEKLLRNQMEDGFQWMAHFDSFQRRAPTRAGAPSAEVQSGWEPLAWDASSGCGADSSVGASVDSTSRCQTRISYLRTMTSLLDPAQIEERERRRVKQLEQQRAIEAQMEERRKLREEEEAKKREEEEREERRLGREREMLQRQYELETRKEKEQPGAGLHAISPQPDAGLHAISQRPGASLHAISPQPGAGLHAVSPRPGAGLHAISPRPNAGLHAISPRPDAGLHAISPRPGAGLHAISPRPDAGLHAISPRPDAGLHAISLQPDAGLHAVSPQPCAGLHAVSPQPGAGLHAISPQTYGGREAGSEDAGTSSVRDTAVQTDTAGGVQTLDVAVQHHPLPPRPTAPPNSRRAEKENVGDPAGDLYQPFARTQKRVGGKRRPEWNTQRPSRRFVPASERYPPDLQRDRQKNRLKRQAELLALQERARPLRPELAPLTARSLVSAPPPSSAGPAPRPAGRWSPESEAAAQRPALTGAGSPPAPLLQSSVPSELVQCLQRKSGSEQQEAALVCLSCWPSSPSGAPTHLRVPPAHTRRQQQILRGLAQLRQGLLQKQKELEMDLNAPPMSLH